SRRRHTRFSRDWSSDVCSSDLGSHVSAIMYTTGQLLAKGSNVNSNNPESTYMTGLFIAERVHGDQNVIWNTADICEPCPVYEGGNQYRSNFEVVSWPNQIGRASCRERGRIVVSREV